MVEETRKTLAEVRSGKAKLIPHEEVMREAMAHAEQLDRED
jgi:hypothetical protein